jgi:TRAP-type uncharacterized transport system fused permease subunit
MDVTGLTNSQVAALVPILIIPLIVMGGALGLLLSWKTLPVSSQPHLRRQRIRAITVWLASLTLILVVASFVHLFPSPYAAAAYVLLAFAWFASTAQLARAARRQSEPMAPPRNAAASIRARMNALAVFIIVLAIAGVIVNVVAHLHR